MHIIEARNVQQALPMGLAHLASTGIPMPSRAGDVLVAPNPVITTYHHPCERVLFWPERDANPFFHFFEGLYFLAGRNDLAFLTQFVKGFDQYSNDGETLSGSYGYRWRFHFGFDQLSRIINLLKTQPFSRRAVLNMWDPRVDLAEDEAANKDVCCNTSIMFRSFYGKAGEPNRLTMTVVNRSNDIIYGLMGANAVHMSMLHEYVAAQLGLVVGAMSTLSNNYHAYGTVYNQVRQGDLAVSGPIQDPYTTGVVKPYALVADPETWDRDLLLFLEDPASVGFLNPFFAQVAKPLHWAHVAYKRKAWNQAFEILDQCMAEDWRLAAGEWLQRRKDAWVLKRREERPREEALL